jgi:phosphomannomutase
MADHGRTLGQLVAELQKEFGEHHYGRVDMHIANEQKQSAIARASSEQTKALGRFKVTRKENFDGIKFFLDAPVGEHGADAWVLMRASGTEPLLRVYSEASSPALVKEILSAAEAFVDEGAAASA